MEKSYLESWLHQIITRKFQEDHEFQHFMGKEKLGQITREDIDRYHVFQFKKTLAYASEKSLFYRELVKKSGIIIDDIRSLADIAKVPFTEPSDIAQHPYHFACVPLGDMARITTFTSSGTTGPQKRLFFTDRDLETMTDFMAAGMKTVAAAGDVVQIMLPSSRPNDQSDLLSQGVKKMGGVPVVTGTNPNSEDQVKTLDRNHSTVLFAAVSRMWRITQETCNEYDLPTKKVKTLFVTSEYLSDTMRKQLQSIWNCDVHAHYGMTEMGLGVAVECHAHQGFHYNEADLIVEVIEPQTGELLGEDTEGELVFTSLNREAMPLIRYRSHDISRLIGKRCPCGAATLQTIAPITRRYESIVKIGKSELYPATFDELLFGIPGIIDYQVTLKRNSNQDILKFKIEIARDNQNLHEIIQEALTIHPTIRQNMTDGILAFPQLELVSQGNLARLNRAKKLILDERRQPSSA